MIIPSLENPAMTSSSVIAGDEPPPPSYESVLNADFGEPPVRPPSPPLPPIPVAEPPRRVPRHSPPPQHPQSQRASPSAPTTPPASRPSRRSVREPRQRPHSTTLPRHLPAYASFPGPPPVRRRSQSEARVRPRGSRRATSPGPKVDGEATRRRRQPYHSQSFPAASPSPRNPIPPPSPGRVRRNSRTPGSVQELLALTQSRRTSFFASNKKTARLVRSSVLDFTTQLDDTTNVEEMLGTLERACTMCNLDLGSILREGKVDGHSPLYWAVVKGRSDSVLKALLKHSPGGMDEEIRLAAIIRSDWKLYQRLRTWLGIPGRVKVEETDDGKGFAVHLQDLSADAGVEFLARGRLWRLAFPVGNVSISLLSHSPQTFIDGHLRVFSSPSVDVPLKSPHLLQPPDRKGRVREVSSPMPINTKLGQARLDVRMTKPVEDTCCVIC